jgi:hypothetical protein
MIPGDYEHNRAEFVLVAPWRKNLTFTFGARLRSGNLHDIRYAKRVKSADLPCACVLIGQSPPDELELLSARGVGEDRNSRRYTALHEIRGLQRARGARIRRYDNDVGEPDRFIDDKRPSRGPQNWLSNGRYRNDGGRGQCDHDQHRAPSRRPGAHARFIYKFARLAPDGHILDPDIFD